MNVLRFLKWMHYRGWPVCLYCRPDSPLFTHAPQYNVRTEAILSGSKASDLFRARLLARMARSRGVEVLVMHQSHDLLMSILTKIHRANRLKVVYQQHMHIAGDKRDFLHAWQYRRLDAFVSPAPSLAEDVKRRTVLRPDSIHIIPLGIEVDRFHRKPPREQARRELELPPDVSMVGCIGRLDPKKGQHVAIKALRRLHDSGLQPHLLVVGAATRNEHDGYTDYLRQLVGDLRLAPFVHFRPHLEQPELAYAAMDLFVLASQSETYGMVTIEAFASALPVIGTDAGGTVDLINHERNGLRFPPDNDTALADALLRYLNDPAFAAQMAAQARCDALAIYSHDRQCDRWEKLLRDLVARQPS